MARTMSTHRIRNRHADNGTVNSWRHWTKMRIARLKNAGFAIAAVDEAFFIHNNSAGRKYWSPIGTPVKVPHAGSAGG